MESTFSPVATLIFISTLGLSIYTLMYNSELLYKMILHPYSMLREGLWYQVITSGFVHNDFMHLGFNMLTFYFFAFSLEKYIGGAAFALIYFTSMVVADLPTIFKNKDNYNYSSLGASGAIAGVLFSFILFAPTMKISMMFIPIGIPAPIFAILYLVYCHFGDRYGQDNVNHSAHLYGAITGFILTMILVPESLPHFISQLPYIFNN